MKNNLMIYPTSWGQVAVAPIPDAEALESGATDEELRSVAGITSPSRRIERLAWRALLRSLSPLAQVEYLPNGKPKLKNSDKHISVSHCRDCVAVALGEKPCGVDVERLDRNFSRVAERYLSPSEAALAADEHWAAVVWCAKEALFKMAGREGVDFMRDMQIVAVEPPVDFVQGRWHLVARLFGEEVELRGVVIDAEHILVFTL